MDKNFIEKLEMVVYTIGYSVEGESIIILIKRDDDFIEYTVVIDGYKVSSCNKTIDILEDNGIKSIDLLCWTHPDKDHSVGLEDYIPYLNSNSTIIIGDGFVEVKDKWENANKKMYSFIVDNIKKRSDNRNKILVRKACTGIRLEEFTFVNMLKSVEYPFKVYTFAPSDMHIMHDQLFDIDTMKNAFSVGIYISIGDYTAVFCADIPDRVFNVLTRRDIPTYIDYIKIPHHGSEKSLNVLKFFDNDVKVACTTVKTSSLLPRRETIDKYKERSENLFCTNNLNTDEQEEEWGVVETCFSIDSKEIVIRPYGNAKEIK